jgi:hypothetical protein
MKPRPGRAAGALPRRLLLGLLSGASAGLERLEGSLHEAHLVTRFLRGRLEFTPRSDDIWVVTYPRSGTTWVQFLLYQLTTSGDMGFSHLNEVSPWFERSLAIGTLRGRDLDALPAPRVLKSHLTPGWLPPGGKVVYVERDPGDVAVSYFHFYRSHLQFQGDFPAFLERFEVGHLQYGRWADHVAEWDEARRRRPVLWLTYEGLRADPEAVVDSLCAFCDLPADASRRQRALERGRFEYMKEHEEKFDHLTALMQERGLRPSRFLRRGRVGDGESAITAHQRRRLQRQRRAGPRRRGRRIDLAAFLH